MTAQIATDYQTQGNDFLKKNKITMTTVFLEHKSYFRDEKETRDIYRVTLLKGRKKYSTKFGQSIIKSTGNGTYHPTAYDLLTCITDNDPGSFEDFCSAFGYDNDSRKAELTWKRVVKDWKAVSKFFSEEELAQLQDIN